MIDIQKANRGRNGLCIRRSFLFPGVFIFAGAAGGWPLFRGRESQQSLSIECGFILTPA
jgi:hypothetical protein